MDSIKDTTIASDCKTDPSKKNPEPLVPVGTVFKKLPRFMLDTDWILSCKLMVSGTAEEFRAQMALMSYAWKQSPPGSLPNDDSELAWMSRSKSWIKIRSAVLSEWVVCSDGRLYHPVLCEDANRAIKSLNSKLNMTKAARAAKLAKASGAAIIPFPKPVSEAVPFDDENIPF